MVSKIIKPYSNFCTQQIDNDAKKNGLDCVYTLEVTLGIHASYSPPQMTMDIWGPVYLSRPPFRNAPCVCLTCADCFNSRLTVLGYFQLLNSIFVIKFSHLLFGPLFASFRSEYTHLFRF